MHDSTLVNSMPTPMLRVPGSSAQRRASRRARGNEAIFERVLPADRRPSCEIALSGSYRTALNPLANAPLPGAYTPSSSVTVAGSRVVISRYLRREEAMHRAAPTELFPASASFKRSLGLPRAC